MIYGLAESASSGGFGAFEVWGPGLTGLVLFIAFVLHALRTPHALLDLRLFKNRTFSAASGTLVLMVISVFGAMLLLPLYLQAVRGESAFDSGLLLAPQGIGAMLVDADRGPAHRQGRRGQDRAPRPGDPVPLDARAHAAGRRHVLLRAERRAVRDGRRHGLRDDAADVGRDADAPPRPGGPRQHDAEHHPAGRRLDRHRRDVRDPHRRAAGPPRQWRGRRDRPRRERRRPAARGPRPDGERVRAHLLVGGGADRPAIVVALLLPRRKPEPVEDDDTGAGEPAPVLMHV